MASINFEQHLCSEDTKSDHALVYMDVSGSMQFGLYYRGQVNRSGSGKDWILENLPLFHNMFGDFDLQTYGQDVASFPQRVTSRFNFKDLNFDGYTYPLNFLSPCNAGIKPPETIIIIGDGEFTGTRGVNGTDYFLHNLRIISEKGFLANLKNFFVFFTPNTRHEIRQELEDALLNFCTVQEGVAISPHFVQCVPGGTEMSSEINENRNRTYLDVPSGWFSVFGMVSFSPDISLSEVSRLVKEHDIELPIKILEKMKYFIQNKPEQLEKGIYSKIHKLLHILFRDTGEYRDFISTTMRAASVRTKEILTRLIESSYQDEEEAKEIMKPTLPYQTDDFVSFNLPRDIFDAIRAKVTLVSLMEDFLNTARPKEEKGFPILNQEAPQQVLETCFRMIFSPYQISDLLKTIVIMSIMISKAELPDKFLEMTKRTAFGMSKTIRNQILCDNPDPVFYAARVCTTVADFLVLFQKEIFPDPSEDERARIHRFLVASRVYKTFGAVKSVMNDLTIVRQIPKGGHRLPVKNDLVLLPSFEGDPQPKLPSLARIISVKNKKGRVWIKVEYLDKEFGTNDTHTYKVGNISETGFEFLAHQASEDLLFTLNRFVMRMSERPELQGPEKDENILKSTLEDFKILLPDLPPMEFEDIHIPVPRKLVINNLVSSPVLRKLLLHGQNPNMKDIINAMEENDDEERYLEFKTGNVQYILTPEDIERLKELFDCQISVRNPEFSLTQLELDNCPICFDECATKDMIQEPCGHRLCKDCNKQLQPNYTSGEIVEAQHLCPCCRELIRFEDENVTSWFNGPRSQLARFCQGCKVFFLQDPPACGGGEEAISKKCDACTVSQFRECPGCKTMVEHTGACDHMQCTNCDTHFCMVCGYTPGEEDESVYEHMDSEHGGIYTIQNQVHGVDDSDDDDDLW
jgi:hypothetical protein